MNFEKQIRRFFIVIACGVSGLLLLATFFGFFVEYSTKKSFAEGVGNAAREELIFANEQKARSILAGCLAEFVSVSYKSSSGLGNFVIGDETGSLFRVKIPIHLFSDTDRTVEFGRLVFSYDAFRTILISFSIWFLLSLLAVPIFQVGKIKIAAAHSMQMEFESSAVYASVSRQVAHDIRSPLSALNIAISHKTELPEDVRKLIHTSVGRINEIARELLKRSQETQRDLMFSDPSPRGGENAVPAILVLPVINEIVNEKRSIATVNSGIEIRLESAGCDAAQIRFGAALLQRILSNLINNSIEAVDPSSGQIIISVRKSKSWLEIGIRDNGKGIPPEVLQKIGTVGFSFGKENSADSGSGLGVAHAKDSIEKCGGKFAIVSKEGMGTIVQLHFLLE